MSVRLLLAAFLLFLTVSLGRPCQAAPPTVEVDLTTGASTQGVLAAASQLRLFGELDSSTRYFLEGAWAASTGPLTDAFGAAYPYEDGFYWMESYLEKSFRVGRYQGAARVGRYRTPFGIYGRGDHAYSGFLRAPLIRYGESYALSNNWLEGGADILFGTPHLQLEASFGVPQDPLNRRREGLDTVVRLQAYQGPFILGASYLDTQPFQPASFAHGRTRFYGVDARWMSNGIQVRGEWIRGHSFEGVTTEGFYVDCSVHKPYMGPVTAVFRYDDLDYFAGPYSFFLQRFTAGAKVRLSRALTGQLNLIYQPDLPHGGDVAVDAALTYSFRR